ncbi:MAG: response regulator [Candidatus Dormibacteria bacterium]
MTQEGEPLVMVVEDDPVMLRFVSDALAARGHRVVRSTRGDEAIQILQSMPSPDLVILDLGLPGMDGLQVVRILRESSTVPVLVLSARGSEADKVAALDSGADDFLAKPFGLPELLARVRAQLRRRSYPPDSSTAATFGDVEVDLGRHHVQRAGAPVQLTPTEFAVLRELVLGAGKVVTHRTLLRRVWGPAYAGENHYTRTFVQRLRAKLERDPSQPQLILTEPGLGYRVCEPDTRRFVVRGSPA